MRSISIEELLMLNLKNNIGRLITDDTGGEVLEYAFIAGLIIVAAIALITSIGAKVVARWTSMDSSV
jgi:Flp pilus assembly pilin Flp